MTVKKPVTFTIHLDEAEKGYVTARMLADVFERVLTVVVEKDKGYGGAWRSQGWMGNLARVMSKDSRLKNMLWRDDPYEVMGDESVKDTVEDLIAIAGLLLLNFQRKNKWGTQP